MGEGQDIFAKWAFHAGRIIYLYIKKYVIYDLDSDDTGKNGT